MFLLFRAPRLRKVTFQCLEIQLCLFDQQLSLEKQIGKTLEERQNFFLILFLFPLLNQTDCNGLNDTCPPQPQAFKYLFPGWWCCLGKFRRCDFVGGSMSLVVGSEVSKSHTSFLVCSLASFLQFTCELPASAPVMSANCCQGGPYPSGTVSQINPSLYKWPWSFQLIEGQGGPAFRSTCCSCNWSQAANNTLFFSDLRGHLYMYMHVEDT